VCVYFLICDPPAWIAGDINQVSSWAVDDSDELQFVSLQRQLVTSVPFAESENRPQDATVYYAAHKVSFAKHDHMHTVVELNID
jgi:hypothetical protein